MMTTTPFSSVLDRMISISRAMENAQAADLPGYETSNRPAVWFPALDSYETDNTFVLEMDIPGVHPENVEISFEANTLTVKGVRAATIKAPDKNDLRVFSSERIAGTFIRAVRLPEYVDGERIEAQYNNGVLTVTVPKSAAAMPRKIAIRPSGEVK